MSGTGVDFGLEKCHEGKHQLLPVMDGAVCTVCGEQFRWVIYTTYPSMRAKAVAKKPWRARPYLVE